MTIPLDRLRTFEGTPPPHGHISIAAARHEAQAWPSVEVEEYAKERAEVLHRLVDEWGVPVTSWGDTDKARPSEVVEIVIPLVVGIIGAIAPGIKNAIERRSKGKKEPSVAGFKITNSCGETLESTFRDKKGKTDKKMLEVITAFLTRSAEDC